MQNKSTFRLSLTAFAMLAALASGAAMAQAAAQDNVPGHPRVNEVNQRLENQQNRIQAGVADGQLNAKQAARDEKQDANIAQRESADEAKHGGHLTKGEQKRLNASENQDSRRIHRQRAKAKAK
ncbi:hypothetical protein [Dyella silvatica]|uniref:hypothetical protein n=1 Tax=Dyella silvatica TaxID=2992128 RepID=UPI00225C198C|nr:hypothetical protein [Dyella silvatica]